MFCASRHALLEIPRARWSAHLKSVRVWMQVLEGPRSFVRIVRVWLAKPEGSACKYLHPRTRGPLMLIPKARRVDEVESL